MTPRQQMYEFVIGVISLVTDPNGMWMIAGPFVTLGIILIIIRISRGAATGQSMERFADDYDDTIQGYQRASRRIRDIRRRP